MEYFKLYEQFGAYPFFTEGEKSYPLRLNEIINIILDSELATIYNVDSDKIHTIRKLLHLLCSSVPVELNIQNLASCAGISRNTLYSYLYYLQKSNLIVKYAQKGDFEIDDTYTFEIGGKNKEFNQIENVPNSFVVADELEVGFGHKIPLWLFGMLY